MSTRFYLPASGSCPITPVADAAWNTTSSYGSYPTDVTKTDTALAHGSTRTSTVSTLENRLDRIYVSSQQLTAQTISAGTFSGATLCQESTTSADAWWQVIIKVVSSDGSTVRGTLYAGSTATTPSATTGAENGEMPAGLFWSRIKNTLSTISVTAQSGDRIQIEVGARWIPGSVGGRSFFIGYGDPIGTTDLALTANSSTSGDPWIELSNTLTWGGVTWTDAPSAAGSGAATVTGFDTVPGALTAAGAATGGVDSLVTHPAPATAAGAGAATVTGFATHSATVAAAGIGAAAVSAAAFVTTFHAPSAAGAGGATVTGFVTTFSVVVAYGVGGGTVVGTGGSPAISFVGVAGTSTSDEFTPSTSSIDSALPAGIIADDLILIACHRQQDYALTGTPAGYTLLDNIIDTDISPSAADTDIVYRFADGSEGTTGPTFTTTSPSRFVVHAGVYRGVNKTTPFIAHAGQAAATSTTSRAAPAITNTDARAWGVFVSNLRNLPSPVTFTPPSGLIERLDSDIGVVSVGISSGNMAAEWADTGGGAVATSSITYTATSSGATSVAISWAAFLKPTAIATQTGTVVAAGSSSATVGGFVTDVSLLVGAGLGAAAVDGPATAIAAATAGGVASAAIDTPVVTTAGNTAAAGVGAGSVTGVRTQFGILTAAGAAAATTGGIPIHAPAPPLVAAGIGAATAGGRLLLVAPSHVAVQATVVFNGISDVTVHPVAPGEADLDDLGAPPDAAVMFDGLSTATVLPVAPGDAIVHTT